MGLEVATYINELNVNWPVATDKVREGDDHLRVIKTALVNSFPNIAGAVELSHTALNLIPDTVTELRKHLCPVGGIMLWSGSTGAIPSGWALCNGANGTPDLRGRFVIGAGGDYAVGATGGAASGNTGTASASITIQGTALTSAQMPSHEHFVAAIVSNTSEALSSLNYLGTHSDDIVSSGNSEYILRSAGAGSAATAGRTSATGGGATHTHSVSQTAHAHSVDTLPPYYALAYIMKTLDWTEPS